MVLHPALGGLRVNDDFHKPPQDGSDFGAGGGSFRVKAAAEKMIPMIPKIISLLPSVLFARTSDNLTDHKLKLSIDYDII